MPGRDIGDSDYRALASFRRQLRKFLAFSEQAAREVGIEPRQHQLLLALRGLPDGADPSVQTLADHLALRHHTVVELLDRLEQAKLVRRGRALDDRRRAEIEITPHGDQLLRRLATAHLDELGSQAPALVGALNGVLLAARKRT